MIATMREFDLPAPARPATRALGATPAREHLARIATTRGWVLLAVSVVLAVLVIADHVALPLPWLMPALGLLLGASVLAVVRVQRGDEIGTREVLGHLVFDIALITWALYGTGGMHNPFAPLFLVPVAVAAVALARPQALVVWGVAAGAVLLLVLRHQPVPEFPRWVEFAGPVLTLACLGYTAMTLVQTNRQHERAVASAREGELNDQHMLDLGAMAAGAAHELSTPLATMAVLVRELELQCEGCEAPAAALGLLARQIETCRQSISELASSAGHARADGGAGTPLPGFLNRVVDSYQVIRPSVRIEVDIGATVAAPVVAADQSLRQALVAMLDSAATASPQLIEFRATWDERWLSVTVRDYGPPLSADAGNYFGEPTFTDKAPGRGLGFGLRLARSTAQGFGGTLSLEKNADGASSVLHLPLESIRV